MISLPCRRLATALAVAMSLTPVVAGADDAPIDITLSGGVFSPSEVTVPAGKPLVLHFVNKETAPVEIEARELKIEKVLPAGGETTARIKPLKPGRYTFVNEFKEDTVHGTVVAE